jgi:hypothetical protein
MAGERKNNKEFEAFKEDFKTWRKKYKVTKTNIEEEIKNVAVAKIHVIKDIKRYKKEIVLRLDELEKQSVELVNERCQKISDEMKALVDKIDQIIIKIDNSLTHFKPDDEENTSMGKKQIKYMREELSNILSNVQKFEGVSICFDKDIKLYMDRLTGLAKINLPSQTKLANEVDIRFESDAETCGVSDICTLSDGTVVMTDLSNDRVKRLDESYGKKEYLQLDGGPLGICATKSGQMAVTLRDRKAVQFLTYTPSGMTLAKSFKTDCSCNYIGYMDGALFVTCEREDNGQGHVRTYDMSGKLLRVIETDNTGNRLFTTPLHITVNSDKTKLYITDMDNKILIIDKNATKTRHITLDNAFGLTALPNDNILVSSIEAHNVCQFDSRDRFVGTVIKKDNGIVNPVCLAYNRFRSHVIVSLDDADTLMVFEVSFT